MPAPYSLDLRERVVAAAASGMSRARAAAHYQVSHSSAIRWTRRLAETGSPAALPMGGKEALSRSPMKRRGSCPYRGEAGYHRMRTAGGTEATRHRAVSYYGVWHFVDRVGLSFAQPARQRAGSSGRRVPAAAMEANTRTRSPPDG